MKKIIYYIFFATLSLMMLFAVQSCECPCDEEVVQEFVCQPRDITINEFIPDLLPVDLNDVIINNETNVIESINYNPVDSFSIHTFKFPDDMSTSGSLPNDPRFQSDQGIAYLPVAKVAVNKVGPSIPFFVAFLSNTPTNDDMVGDILVEDIDLQSNPADPLASLKFAGSLYRISQRAMPSESSREFCEYLEDNNLSDEGRVMNEYRPNLSEYGEAYGITNNFNYNEDDLVILNQNNQVVAAWNGATWDFRSEIINGTQYYFLNENTRDNLINDFNAIDREKAVEELQAMLADKSDVTVEVGLGDIFFYRAVNGRDFIMTIINISQKQLGNAYKKRISIMFNEI